MSMGVEHNSDFVRRAAAELEAHRPAYAKMVAFYGSIFAAQEDARQRIRVEPFNLSPELAETKIRDGIPLIQVAEMRFDPRAAETLFAELCRIAVDRRSGLAGPAEALLKHPAQIKPLFQSFLDGNDERVAAAAASMGAGPAPLSFFLYHSLRPAFCRCAQDLSRAIADARNREQTGCPICGGMPALAWLEGEGQRFLTCGFCWHVWPAARPLCPCCGAGDPARLSYLYSEEEKAYRIDRCDACRKYIKTVDTRNLARGFYPPLEQIASLHLDIKAAEAGYEPALPVTPPV